ncbi:hypothetical protein NKG05_10995 [Oerskovia sp. M15]
MCERAEDKRGGEIDRALTCLSAESLAPDAEGNLWWPGVLDESVKHTVGVSRTSVRACASRSRSSRTRWCADAPPRASIRSPRRRRSRSPSSRCASCTASCSCSTPRRRPSWGPADR